MAKDAQYWAERRDDLLAQLEKSEEVLNAKLAKLYKREADELQRDIAAYYQEYGRDNVIEYRKLLVSLKEQDRRLLMEKMDEFEKKYPKWAYLMPVRASIYQLNELEGIQTAIYLQQLEIGAIEIEKLTEHLSARAMNAANLAAEEMGFGTAFYNINAEAITMTVGAAWSQDKSYSERIWDNREKLAAYLNDDFAKMLARGVSYDQMARELRERFEDVSVRDAKRLIFTEGSFVFNEAQAQVFAQDFDSYYIETCKDKRVCKICREIAANSESEPFSYKDRQPGANFPPFHPWCRCSAVPYVSDWDAWIDDYVAKRGGDAITKGR